MNWQDVAIATIGIGGAVAGWFLRELWAAVKSLRADLQKLQESLPGTYARRDDVRDMFDQLMQAIRDVHADLKTKADK